MSWTYCKWWPPSPFVCERRRLPVCSFPHCGDCVGAYKMSCKPQECNVSLVYIRNRYLVNYLIDTTSEALTQLFYWPIIVNQIYWFSLQTYNLSSYKALSLTYDAPKIWNDLPDDAATFHSSRNQLQSLSLCTSISILISSFPNYSPLTLAITQIKRYKNTIKNFKNNMEVNVLI